MINEKSLRLMLREQTAEAHRAIERNSFLLSLQAPELTPEQYCKILERYLGFFRPLERRLAEFRQMALLVSHFDERLRAPALVADLKAMNRSQACIDALADCEMLPNLPADPLLKAAAAIGIVYVLEGSSLGGVMIGKQLSEHEFISPINTEFLAGRREKTGILWQEFLKSLEVAEKKTVELPDPSAILRWRSQAIESAGETFEKMNSWMANG
jgi:heme oxygenase